MLQNYELFAVTLEGDDKQGVMNQVLISDTAEYYIFIPLPTTKKQKIVLESTEFESIEELDAKLQEHVTMVDKGQWICSICQQVAPAKSKVISHVERHFKTIWFPCQDCNAKPRTRNSLRAHRNINHSH